MDEAFLSVTGHLENRIYPYEYNMCPFMKFLARLFSPVLTQLMGKDTRTSANASRKSSGEESYSCLTSILCLKHIIDTMEETHIFIYKIF